MSEKAADGGRLGMYLELRREIWPQLYDELVRLSKGTARVQRLRALAYAGLLAERRAAEGAVRPPATELERAPSLGAAGIFEAPLGD